MIPIIFLILQKLKIQFGRLNVWNDPRLPQSMSITDNKCTPGYAKFADHVVIMTEGEIEIQGKTATLEEKGYKFENSFGSEMRVGRNAQRIGTRHLKRHS